MENSIIIKLSEILASEPKVFDIGDAISINEVYFPRGIIKKIVMENYAGAKQINLYSDSFKIATFSMFKKTECNINTIIEDGESTIIITAK